MTWHGKSILDECDEYSFTWMIHSATKHQLPKVSEIMIHGCSASSNCQTQSYICPLISDSSPYKSEKIIIIICMSESKKEIYYIYITERL